MGQHTFEVTDANFQDKVVKSDTPVLVDFWATWCGPCKMIAPIVDEIAKKYEGKLHVGKMDVDANPNVPMMFDVQGIPTLILFKDGKAVKRILGFKPHKQLEDDIVPFLQLEKA